MEPGVEALDLAKPRELAPGRDEGLLHGVLGPMDIAQDPMRDGEEPIRRAAGEEANASSSPDRAARTSDRSTLRSADARPVWALRPL